MRKILSLLSVLVLTLSAFAQRLPDTASPTHYALHFTPDLKAATFGGDETIDLTIKQPTSVLTLNSAEITYQNITLTQNGQQQSGAAKPDEAKQMVEISFPKQLQAGAAQLHITYQGILNDKLRGFYLSKGQGRNYATTQFESTDARRAFPSFDEPAYKATFDLALTIDTADTAISNGSIATDEPGPEGKHTLTFTTTPKMSTYLVAMAVGDWKCSSGEQDGVPIRICATPDKVNLTSYALTSAKQILHFYNTYYGIKWPWKKLDVLAVPDFEAGAMENTAAIFYRESALLIDEQHASVESHVTVFDVLAHEMAHQWFGDLVTMQWWNDIWLNEGFATWMTFKPNEAVHPEWKGSMREADQTAQTLIIDARKSTRAIRQQANTPDEINELFDGIAYQKAASVLRMVENYVGPDRFRDGVNEYLKQHAYGNATAEDFWGTMTRVSGKPVDKVMASFTQQAGAPLLSFNISCQGAPKIEASQQRLFSTKALFGSAPGQVWTIPVCVHTASGGSACRLFESKQASHVTPNCMSGSFFNANGRGFYRTQYDPASLKALNIEKLTPEERILLETDQWALLRAGQQSIGGYMDTLSKLSGDHEGLVLQQLLATINTMDDQLVDDSDRPQFEAWVRKTFKPQLERIGLDPVAQESPDAAVLRGELYGLLGGIGKDPQVIAKCREITDRYLQDPTSVDATLAPEALQVAADSGDAALYDKMIAALDAAKTPEQYEVLGGAITAFRQPELVKRTILYATTDKVRNQDSARFFAIPLFRPETRDTAWQVVQQNWQPVSSRLTESSGGIVVNGAGSFCSPEKKQEVQSFFAQHPVASAERTLRQSLERIDTCNAFRAENAAGLKQWLAAH